MFCWYREWQVLAHIFKAFVGIGVLGLPSAVMHGGLVVRNSFAYLAEIYYNKEKDFFFLWKIVIQYENSCARYK